jgi:hypothetical protein
MLNQILKNKARGLSEYWFLIPVLIYTFSFGTEYTYYKAFEIDIVYYVSTNDLIFLFGTYFIGYVITVIFALILTILVNSIVKPLIWQIAVKLILSLLFLCLSYKNYFIFNKESWGLSFWSFFWSCKELLKYFTAWRKKIERKPYESITSGITITGILIILLLIQSISLYFKIDLALKGGERHIEFTYNGNTIESNKDTRIFLGETSNFIFFYNKKNKSASFFKKENIDNKITSDFSRNILTNERKKNIDSAIISYNDFIDECLINMEIKDTYRCPFKVMCKNPFTILPFYLTPYPDRKIIYYYSEVIWDDFIKDY